MRRIRRISLRDFRSYDSLDLPLDGRSVALTGANGSGKTNLLESLSLIGPGRGLRRATFAEVGRQGGGGGWGIGLDLQQRDEAAPVSMSVHAALPEPVRRTCRVDGETVASATHFLDYVRFAWLTPAQDRLFMDGPGERRRFLDRLTLSTEKDHGHQSTAYEKAMRQRQAALKAGGSDPQLLTVLERQMATAGVAITTARRRTAGALRSGYASLRVEAFPAASLALEGWLDERLDQYTESELEGAFADALAASRRSDMEAGRALIGPHRSDMLVRHVGKDQPAKRCSTGEQKALLIGLVLAHAAGLAERREVPLVLLLDEVAAHLDRVRRAALADILDRLGCQAIMTGTDPELFEAWADRAQHFEVGGGTVRDRQSA